VNTGLSRLEEYFLSLSGHHHNHEMKLIMARRKNKAKSLREIQPDLAGVDIGASEI
jgi:hypothetical protein